MRRVVTDSDAVDMRCRIGFCDFNTLPLFFQLLGVCMCEGFVHCQFYNLISPETHRYRSWFDSSKMGLVVRWTDIKDPREGTVSTWGLRGAVRVRRAMTYLYLFQREVLLWWNDDSAKRHSLGVMRKHFSMPFFLLKAVCIFLDCRVQGAGCRMFRIIVNVFSWRNELWADLNQRTWQVIVMRLKSVPRMFSP